MHIYIHIYTHVYMHVCMYVGMYVGIYLCINELFKSFVHLSIRFMCVYLNSYLYFCLSLCFGYWPPFLLQLDKIYNV